MSFVPRNRVLFVLIAGAIVTCLLTGFVSEAPNRLISGHALALLRVSPPLTMLAIIGLGLALLLLAFWPDTRRTQGAAIVMPNVYESDLVIVKPLLLMMFGSHVPRPIVTQKKALKQNGRYYDEMWMARDLT